ncbi:MAG: hypothetical protein J6T10_26585 [Methanobrevibacter sp.]|nr:hypothetical protein [Methanobrevibacter sp.]
MWQTVDYKGNTVKWYEAELIEKIKATCIKRPYQALDKILELIQENEK